MGVHTIVNRQSSTGNRHETVSRHGTVAEIIVAQLADWGIGTVYGVSGDSIFPLLDAIAQQDKVAFLPTVHEFSAACMAVAEARLTGRPAVCTATGGPGTVNLLNGLAEAYRDRVPLLAITGDVNSQTLGLNVKQGINQQQLLAAVAAYSAMIRDPAEALAVLLEAMRVAVELQTAVHVTIPKDIFSQPASGTLLPMPPAMAPALPPTDIFVQAASLCKSFSRPLILAGQASRGAAAQTVQLAESLSAGIILAQGAKGIVAGTHPLVLGGLGEAYIPAPLSQADGLIMIGTAPFETSYLPPNLPVIQFASRPEYLWHAPVPPAVGLAGDIPGMLQEFTGLMAGYRPASEWAGMLATGHHNWLRLIEDDTRDQSLPPAPRRLAAELNRLLTPDAILAVDIGEFMHWFDRSFCGQRQRLLLSDYWRCMGAALPAAIAAKRLYPYKQVVALTGDGGFIMSMQELITAAKYELPVKIIIFNNSQYALEKHKMKAGGWLPLGVNLTNPDFVMFARACGAAGYRIDTADELAKVLPVALNDNRPTVIEVIVSTPVPPHLKQA